MMNGNVTNHKDMQVKYKCIIQVQNQFKHNIQIIFMEYKIRRFQTSTIIGKKSHCWESSFLCQYKVGGS